MASQKSKDPEPCTEEGGWIEVNDDLRLTNKALRVYQVGDLITLNGECGNPAARHRTYRIDRLNYGRGFDDEKRPFDCTRLPGEDDCSWTISMDYICRWKPKKPGTSS